MIGNYVSTDDFDLENGSGRMTRSLGVFVDWCSRVFHGDLSSETGQHLNERVDPLIRSLNVVNETTGSDFEGYDRVKE